MPIDDLIEIISSKHAEDLFIGGVVDFDDRQVVLYRGTFDPIVVPLGWFRRRDGGCPPDPHDLEVIDCGQTVRLGEYEAAADAILYELDPNSRRRMKQAARLRDDSFGGALRRLRLQKGVRRGDFGSLSAKTIARIERGDVHPRRATVREIAARLGVEPEEIPSF